MAQPPKTPTRKTTARKPAAKTAATAPKAPARPTPKRKPVGAAKKRAATKGATASSRAARIGETLSGKRNEVGKFASEKARKLRGDAARYSDEAAVKAKGLARDGRDKTASGLSGLATYIRENASTVDEKFGTQYGEYARSAATSIADLAATVEQQDIDEMIDGTRDFVRKSPSVAIGAAAIGGFLIARMLKGPSSDA